MTDLSTPAQHAEIAGRVEKALLIFGTTMFSMEARLDHSTKDHPTAY